MGTNRYVTNSDRLVEYRHPVAKPLGTETLNYLREQWWKLERTHRGDEVKAGLLAYVLLKEVFGTGTDELVVLTEYDEDECLDVWDLDEAQEIEPD